MITNANIAKINDNILAVTLGQVLTMEEKIKSGKMTRVEVDETRYQLGTIRSLLGDEEQDKYLARFCLLVSNRVVQDFLQLQTGHLSVDLGVALLNEPRVFGSAQNANLLHFFDLCRAHKELVENRISKDDPI